MALSDFAIDLKKSHEYKEKDGPSSMKGPGTLALEPDCRVVSKNRRFHVAQATFISGISLEFTALLTKRLRKIPSGGEILIWLLIDAEMVQIKVLNQLYELP